LVLELQVPFIELQLVAAVEDLVFLLVSMVQDVLVVLEVALLPHPEEHQEDLLTNRHKIQENLDQIVVVLVEHIQTYHLDMHHVVGVVQIRQELVILEQLQAEEMVGMEYHIQLMELQLFMVLVEPLLCIVHQDLHLLSEEVEMVEVDVVLVQ
jgi:hypothetical protein